MNKWLENATAFAVADLKAFRRDGQAMFWTFFFPIMFMVLLGLVFGNAQVIDLKVGILDDDHTPAALQFGTQLDGLPNVQTVWFNASDPGGTDARNQSVKDALINGDVSVYVVIPSGYSAVLIDHFLNGDNATSHVNISLFWAMDNSGNGQVAKLVLQQYISEINFASMNETRVVLTGDQAVQVTRGRYIDSIRFQVESLRYRVGRIG